MVERLLYELGWSYKYLLQEMQRNGRYFFHLLPVEIIEKIIDKIEELTEFKSKSQMIKYFNSGLKFIFRIKECQLYLTRLKTHNNKKDKFRFHYINLNGLIDGGFHDKLLDSSKTILFCICRKFIKIYIKQILVAKMDKFFTIRKVNCFETESPAGKILAANLLQK